MVAGSSVVFVTLCVYYSICATTATLSGLYLDNGIDQTVMQHVMTRQEKEEVEHEILHLLGLPDRPRSRVRTTITSPLASSAPKFLLDVYKSLLEPSVNRAPRSEFNLSGRDLHAIDESDVIMSFTSQSAYLSPDHHEPGVRHERGKRLWFDVAEVPLGESIVGAELRLYQTASSAEPPEEYTITLYQVAASQDGGEKELEYVDAVNTTSDNEGWLLVNLTTPLASWVAFPDSNLGLYMSVHQPNRPSHEIHPEDAGIVGTKGEEERRPFMVAFLKASIRRDSRRVRAAKEAPKRSKKANSSTDNYTRNTYIHPAIHWSSRSCQIQTLYVSFRDLEWQDWIIAPDGYGAFYCSGECNFPLNAHMNATNHAIVQTLVHLMKPAQVPKPCCAPTKLTPISVLYFLDDTNVILKKYKNMVVKSCGCH